MGFSTVRGIVIEVCDAIWTRLGPIVMPQPTEMIWKGVAERYNNGIMELSQLHRGYRRERY